LKWEREELPKLCNSGILIVIYKIKIKWEKGMKYQNRINSTDVVRVQQATTSSTVVQPRQVDADVAEAFDDDRNIGEVALAEELGQTWCGEAGGDSKWGRRGLVEDWGIVAGEHRG
jgi:hypothetical protein